MKTMNYLLLVLSGSILLSCTNKPKKEEKMETYEKGTFGYDLNYLSSKDSLIVLSAENGKSQVIVSAKYQAKVFTSTVDGLSGKSLGWIGYKALDAQTLDEHINAYGGENRFWLGPEGGQFSIYFKAGDKQVFENWHTPKPFDTEAWEIVAKDKKTAIMKKEMEVTNYKGTSMKINVDRKVSLLEPAQVASSLGVSLDPQVNVVAYLTENTITNLNDFAWTKETGTVCIWILDMMNPGEKALTIIPFNAGEEKELGKVATTDYFGEIPADRLKITDKTLYFKTDGKHRSKLGLNAKRTHPVAGNYNPETHLLTIVTFDVDKEATYLNQEWNITRDPLVGDAVNAYNDGPLEDGSIMGPFFEVESCSPAAFLQPAQSLTHKQTVYHFVGDEAELTKISEKLLGVSLDEVKKVF